MMVQKSKPLDSKKVRKEKAKRYEHIYNKWKRI